MPFLGLLLQFDRKLPHRLYLVKLSVLFWLAEPSWRVEKYWWRKKKKEERKKERKKEKKIMEHAFRNFSSEM